MSESMNYCKFCGQVLLDDNDCKCPGATAEREIKQKINNAKKAIDRLFTNYCIGETPNGEKLALAPPSEEAVCYMKRCVELIARGFINKSSIILPGGVKANITTKNGAIKVERVETIKDSVEAH